MLDAEGDGVEYPGVAAVGQNHLEAGKVLHHAVERRPVVGVDVVAGVDPALPLFTFIGRLTSQKGVDVLLQAIPLLLARSGKKAFQLLILGSGAPDLEEYLVGLTEEEVIAGRICFLKGYDPALATKIYAAGDFFLIPSLYEPCGLTDYIAQLLGNLPIVHHVGGLVKVLDGKTGFAYQEHAPEALAGAMQQALTVYGSELAVLEKMQQAAVVRIRNKHSWQKVMEEYLQLYRSGLAMTESG